MSLPVRSAHSKSIPASDQQEVGHRKVGRTFKSRSPLLEAVSGDFLVSYLIHFYRLFSFFVFAHLVHPKTFFTFILQNRLISSTRVSTAHYPSYHAFPKIRPHHRMQRRWHRIFSRRKVPKARPSGLRHSTYRFQDGASREASQRDSSHP